MATVLTQKQLDDININLVNEDILPNNTARVYETDNKIFLIVDITKLYDKIYKITPADVITAVETYSKDRYKLYLFSYPFIFLYKKRTFLEKIKRFFKKKQTKA